MVKLVLNDKQFRITIPKDFAILHGWTSGTKLFFVEDPKGKVLVREFRLDKKE